MFLTTGVTGVSGLGIVDNKVDVDIYPKTYILNINFATGPPNFNLLPTPLCLANPS